MKHEILNVKFKVFRDDVDTIMKNIENFCDVNSITYTYSVRHHFWPVKSTVTAEFEGQQEDIERVETYLRKVKGIS